MCSFKLYIMRKLRYLEFFYVSATATATTEKYTDKILASLQFTKRDKKFI